MNNTLLDCTCQALSDLKNRPSNITLTSPLWGALTVVGINPIHADSSISTLMTRTVVNIVLTVSPIETCGKRKIWASKPWRLFVTFIIISSFTCALVGKSTHKYYLKIVSGLWCVYRDCKQRLCLCVCVCFCCINIPVVQDWQETVWQQTWQDQTVCIWNIKVTLWETKVTIIWWKKMSSYRRFCNHCRQTNSTSVLVFAPLLHF